MNVLMTKTSIVAPIFAALTSVAVVAAPIQKAVAQATSARPSTPVIVVNPSTDPALTSSIDNPGRIAYQSTAQASCDGHIACQFSFATVSQGKRLVVQHVSGFLSFNKTPDVVGVFLGATTNGISPTLTPGTSPFFFSAPSFDNISLFDQRVLYYVDGGIPVDLIVYLPGSANVAGNFVPPEFSNPQSVTLTGYLLDCAASQCPAIAQ